MELPNIARLRNSLTPFEHPVFHKPVACYLGHVEVLLCCVVDGEWRGFQAS